jgi:hypothetical protein
MLLDHFLNFFDLIVVAKKATTPTNGVFFVMQLSRDPWQLPRISR